MRLLRHARKALTTQIQTLDQQRARLVRALGYLDDPLGGGKPKAVSTRKMSAAQKKAVSVRMKAYWRKRRAERAVTLKGKA